MILAMSKDIRVILIKLADRYHNKQTLNFLPPEKQAVIAKETLEIYAPLAHRLGIEWLKGELEDLSFKYLKPVEYRLMSDNIARKKRERDAYIEEVKELIASRLEQLDLKCQVSGRAKRLYSIYRKMVQERLNLDEIYDITAFRVLVGTVKECYEGLGYIHDLFKPIPGNSRITSPCPRPICTSRSTRRHRAARGEDRDTDQDLRDAPARGGGYAPTGSTRRGRSSTRRKTRCLPGCGASSSATKS